MQITCQVLGAIVLIVCVVSIERRLAILEHTIGSMTSKGVRNGQSRQSMQFGGHGASPMETKANTSNERYEEIVTTFPIGNFRHQKVLPLPTRH